MTATASLDLERAGFTRERGEALAYLLGAWVLGLAAAQLGMLVAVHQQCFVGRLVEALRPAGGEAGAAEAGAS